MENKTSNTVQGFQNAKRWQLTLTRQGRTSSFKIFKEEIQILGERLDEIPSWLATRRPQAMQTTFLSICRERKRRSSEAWAKLYWVGTAGAFQLHVSISVWACPETPTPDQTIPQGR